MVNSLVAPLLPRARKTLTRLERLELLKSLGLKERHRAHRQTRSWLCAPAWAVVQAGPGQCQGAGRRGGPRLAVCETGWTCLKD